MTQATIKMKAQAFGRFLSNMVMPNIGAFIAWGFITALFIQSGWIPVAALGGFDGHTGLVGPMVNYLLPLLIGYTGGKLAGGERGAVVGAITTMGVIVGTDIPMFLGAMIVGPLGGWAIKTFDRTIDGKIKSGFEMLVNNFSVGIIGLILCIISFYAIGPVVKAFSAALAKGVAVLVSANLLPLTSIFVEPAKILFLNNAINHGIFTPLGIEQVDQIGRSIFFLIEANPGPGLGILLAYMFFGKGSSKQTAGGAAIIHFFGGIHEIYFPYVLMNPRLLIAAIAGGMTGVFILTVFNAGLVSPAAPGSIIAILAMTPKGGYLPILASVFGATLVSFVIASIFVRVMPETSEDDLNQATEKMHHIKHADKLDSEVYSDLDIVYVACDAGMGSSATGASMLRRKVNDAGLNLKVQNMAINDLPATAKLVITHRDLTPLAQKRLPHAQHLSLINFLDRSFYNQVVEMLKEKMQHDAPKMVPAHQYPEFSFGEDQIFLNQASMSKEDAIRFVGNKLVEKGFVKPDYVDAMLVRENDSSTYLGEGIAMPHGTLQAKDQVLKTGIVFAQFPQGIAFSKDDDDKAYLLIAIAAKNNEHIGIIAALTNALDDEHDIETLKTTTDPQVVLAILQK